MALASLGEWVAAFDRFAPVMISAAGGSVMVLGLAGLATLVMRRASAAARHEVWMLGFAGALLLPVLSVALPGWHVLPHLGAALRASPAGDALVEVTVLPFSESAQVTPLPNAQPPADSAHSTPDKETIMTTNSESPNARPPQAAAVTPAVPSQLNPSVSQAPQRGLTTVGRLGSLPWTAWLALCWVLGSLLVLCRVLLGHLSLWWLRRRCSAVTRGELFDQLERLRKELRIRRPVELLSCPARTMPMTWGLWRPRLLVPAQAADWPAGQRHDVLLHELGHVRRRDCLTHLLSQVACALYWFNPLAWVAGRRMQVERGRACDDLVLNRGAEAPAYARHLLKSVSSVPVFRLAGAAVAMARPSTLEERMRAILDGRMNRHGLTARGTLATVLLLLSVLVPVAVLRAQEDPAPERPANSRAAQAARGGREGREGSPESPATRPAIDPQTGRPAGAPAPRFGGRGAFGGGVGGSGFGGRPGPVLGEGPTCTFDATIYDVRIPADQIGRLDVDALAKASDTAEAFEKALAALGTTKPMYRANQSVRLSGDSIVIGSEVPIVTNSRLSDKGQAMNTITYQNVGALFDLVGKADGPGGIDLDLGIQVTSSSNDGGAAITDKVNAPIMRKASLSRKGPVQPRKPFVVLSVDAGSLDKDGKAVAYIGRITMGEPQAPAAR